MVERGTLSCYRGVVWRVHVLRMVNGFIDEELKDVSFFIHFFFFFEPAGHRNGHASRFIINMPTIRDTF